ncbi:MAG: hypothetical protein J6Z79_05165 [Clostridia bacterium]|nr:hypothetical protein [Clostridia bacterium]
MKRKLICALAFLAAAAEALPWSASLQFADKGGMKRVYFSSFDPSPFVGRNFGPFLAAVASSVLLVAALVYLFGKKGLPFLRVMAGAAFLFSLLPLLHPGEHFTWLGGGISLVLLAVVVLSFLPLPDGTEKKTAGKKKKK